MSSKQVPLSSALTLRILIRKCVVGVLFYLQEEVVESSEYKWSLHPLAPLSFLPKDLKTEQVIGTGRESGGLYYFDEYPPKLLASITGSQKISLTMTIVVSGIAKMLVGELVETGRIVMAERNESGPIRPCHIREAYRRLKLEGKIPKRSVPRLFR